MYILSSYEILVDADARAEYDRVGVEGMARGAGGASKMEEDFFESLFGGGMRFGFAGMGGGRRRPRKGEDSIIPYDVTLEDLYNGKTVKMMMEREIVCETCKGCVSLLPSCYFKLTRFSSGAKGNAKPKACGRCEGKGWVVTDTPVYHNSLLYFIIV